MKLQPSKPCCELAQLTIRIPEKTMCKIKKEAAKTGISTNEAVKQLLEQAVKALEKQG